jgi:hypothetical protein
MRWKVREVLPRAAALQACSLCLSILAAPAASFSVATSHRAVTALASRPPRLPDPLPWSSPPPWSRSPVHLEEPVATWVDAVARPVSERRVDLDRPDDTATVSEDDSVKTDRRPLTDQATWVDPDAGLWFVRDEPKSIPTSKNLPRWDPTLPTEESMAGAFLVVTSLGASVGGIDLPTSCVLGCLAAYLTTRPGAAGTMARRGGTLCYYLTAQAIQTIQDLHASGRVQTTIRTLAESVRTSGESVTMESRADFDTDTDTNGTTVASNPESSDDTVVSSLHQDDDKTELVFPGNESSYGDTISSDQDMKDEDTVSFHEDVDTNDKLASSNQDSGNVALVSSSYQDDEKTELVLPDKESDYGDTISSDLDMKDDGTVFSHEEIDSNDKIASSYQDSGDVALVSSPHQDNNRKDHTVSSSHLNDESTEMVWSDEHTKDDDTVSSSQDNKGDKRVSSSHMAIDTDDTIESSSRDSGSMASVPSHQENDNINMDDTISPYSKHNVDDSDSIPSFDISSLQPIPSIDISSMYAPGASQTLDQQQLGLPRPSSPEDLDLIAVSAPTRTPTPRTDSEGTHPVREGPVFDNTPNRQLLSEYQSVTDQIDPSPVDDVRREKIPNAETDALLSVDREVPQAKSETSVPLEKADEMMAEPSNNIPREPVWTIWPVDQPFR